MRVDQTRTQHSAQLFAEACAVIPGGVNSPVRAFTAVGGTPRFITSASGCWLTDADGLFDELLEQIPWRAERRQMYERVLDVPRMVSFHHLVEEPAPHPRLKQMRRRLNDTYGRELGEPFTTAGLCLYRDGNDSVAWHGDKIGRSSTEDTMVAIVSLGATRVFALRPRGGGIQTLDSTGLILTPAFPRSTGDVMETRLSHGDRLLLIGPSGGHGGRQRSLGWLQYDHHGRSGGISGRVHLVLGLCRSLESDRRVASSQRLVKTRKREISHFS